MSTQIAASIRKLANDAAQDKTWKDQLDQKVRRAFDKLVSQLPENQQKGKRLGSYSSVARWRGATAWGIKYNAASWFGTIDTPGFRSQVVKAVQAAVGAKYDVNYGGSGYPYLHIVWK